MYDENKTSGFRIPYTEHNITIDISAESNFNYFTSLSSVPQAPLRYLSPPATSYVQGVLHSLNADDSPRINDTPHPLSQRRVEQGEGVPSNQQLAERRVDDARKRGVQVATLEAAQGEGARVGEQDGREGGREAGVELTVVVQGGDTIRKIEAVRRKGSGSGGAEENGEYVRLEEAEAHVDVVPGMGARKVESQGLGLWVSRHEDLG